MIMKKFLLVILIFLAVSIIIVYVLKQFDRHVNNQNNSSQIQKYETGSAISTVAENEIYNQKLLNNTVGVPVLLYHVISSSISKGSYGFLPLSLFKRQLDYLKQEGYVTISLDNLYNYMISGENIPEKSIILSFDDTNESDYTIVFPELKKRGFKGVFFTIVSKANTLKWKDKLQEMYFDGMEIVSHTMSHKYSGGGPSTNGKRINVDDVKIIRYELSESKKILESITNSKVNYLAWPGDSYTDNMIKLAQEIGYKGLFMAKTDFTENIMKHPKSKSGFNKMGDDVLHIKRITINGANSLDDFKLILRDGIYPRL